MRRVSGQAEARCRASASDVDRILRAIEAYPTWGAEVVRAVGVLERDGAGYPRTLQATLRVEIGPIPLDLDLTLEVTAERPGSITLTRLPNDPGDEETFVAVWHVDEDRTAGTTIRLDLEASVDLPRLIPIGDVGTKLAKRLVDAAAAASDAGSALV